MTSSWNLARHLNNEGMALIKSRQLWPATDKLTRAPHAVKQVISTLLTLFRILVDLYSSFEENRVARAAYIKD